MSRLLALGMALAWGGAAGTAFPEAPQPRPVTFSGDIAPILFEHCAVCHRPGGAGPFSLLGYEDARRRARQIAEVTSTRFMPPWLPAPEPGFLDERRLDEKEIHLLRLWSEQGAPPGDPAALPSPPDFPASWGLGQPDLVLRAAEPFELPAEGRDVFRNFVFQVPLDGVRYVEALEILPGNPKVVHHANVLLDRSGEGRRRDREDPGPGFGGMELELESERFEPQTHFLFWKPGSAVRREEPGMSWPIDGKTDLLLNMHMQPSGKPERIRPSIGLYFTPRAPDRFPMLIQLENDRALDIPAGEADFVVEDELSLPVAVRLLGVYPHAHYLGRRLQARATLPDGRQRPLITIPDWNFDWQGVFRYREPLDLPAGTRLALRYSYDNSARNPQNPHSPPRRVTAGNQSSDEMAHLWLQVLPAREGDRLRLQEALMLHRLERYPGDTVARANLGSVYQLQGRLEEAIGHYREAVRLDPADAVSLNSLGAALQAAGRHQEALPLLERAVQARPGYAHAHFNLANALLAAGRGAEAVTHLRRVLEADPEDAPAHLRLGYLYVGLGRLEESIGHYRKALSLQPPDADTLNDFGTVLARSGRLAEARAQFERSVELDPADPAAHGNLGLIEAGSGNLAAALEHFREAVRLAPDDADAHNNLGIALARTGRLEEAARHFERALELAPGHAQARENLRRARNRP